MQFKHAEPRGRREPSLELEEGVLGSLLLMVVVEASELAVAEHAPLDSLYTTDYDGMNCHLSAVSVVTPELNWQTQT